MGTLQVLPSSLRLGVPAQYTVPARDIRTPFTRPRISAASKLGVVLIARFFRLDIGGIIANPFEEVASDQRIFARSSSRLPINASVVVYINTRTRTGVSNSLRLIQGAYDEHESPTHIPRRLSVAHYYAESSSTAFRSGEKSNH